MIWERVHALPGFAGQAQLDALTAAHCREIVIETASTRDARPKLRSTLAGLHPGDTLVIYKPGRRPGGR